MIQPHRSLPEAARLYKAGENEAAATICRDVLTINPTNIDALRLLGVIARNTQRVDEAIDWLSRAVQVRPHDPVVQFELGSSYRVAERIHEALDHYRRALELQPDFQEACNNIGGILEELGRPEEALPHNRRAVELKPGCQVAHYNLANSLMALGEVEEAAAHHQRALQILPDYARAHWNLALCYLLLRDYERGWQEYEWREAAAEVVIDKYPQTRWRGESLAGKTLLIHAEQGVGDEILFASCYRELAEQAAKLIVTCDTRLAPLFARSIPEAEIHGVRRLSHGKPAGIPGADSIDLQIPCGSVPLYLRRRTADFPRRSAFLFADASQVAQWRERYEDLGAGLKIGISWRTGGKPSGQRRRSTTLDQWQALFALPGVTWVNLQYGDCHEELADAARRLGVRIHDFEEGDPLVDMDTFAARVAGLDLVISMGNATAHLAAALGRPTWAILPKVPTWRWLLSGETTPWYLSARLFRQETRGDWTPLFERIQQELAARLGADVPTARPLAKPLSPPTSAEQAHDPNFKLPDVPRLVEQAAALQKSGEFAAAEEIYLQVLQHVPRDLQALQLMGALANQTGRPDVAVRYLRRAISIDGEQPLLHFNLGNAYLNQGRLPEAERHYKEAVTLEPEMAAAHLNLGSTYARESRIEEAIASCETALRLRPDYSDAEQRLATLLSQRLQAGISSPAASAPHFGAANSTPMPQVP